jgi:hypothetical protein
MPDVSSVVVSLYPFLVIHIARSLTVTYQHGNASPQKQQVVAGAQSEVNIKARMIFDIDI